MMMLSFLKDPPTPKRDFISRVKILKSSSAPLYPSIMVTGFPLRFSYLQIKGSS